MEVDRSRFLLLVAALAVTACNNKTETKAEPKDPPAAKQAPAAKQDPEPEPVAKEFGVKGTPEPAPAGEELPAVEPEPEPVAPSPIKE